MKENDIWLIVLAVLILLTPITIKLINKYYAYRYEKYGKGRIKIRKERKWNNGK